jgi:hemolysin activation/secretion protein
LLFSGPSSKQLTCHFAQSKSGSYFVGVPNDVSFYAALAGQQAHQNLDSSERFYLGGANGVRAYPANEAGGSSANLANLELRWKLSDGVTLAGFIDSGAVRNYENAGNNYSLSGAGLTLLWQASAGVNLKATWASRIGNNPYPANATESNKHDRFWLSASLPF